MHGVLPETVETSKNSKRLRRTAEGCGFYHLCQFHFKHEYISRKEESASACRYYICTHGACSHAQHTTTRPFFTRGTSLNLVQGRRVLTQSNSQCHSSTSRASRVPWSLTSSRIDPLSSGYSSIPSGPLRLGDSKTSDRIREDSMIK